MKGVDVSSVLELALAAQDGAVQTTFRHESNVFTPLYVDVRNIFERGSQANVALLQFLGPSKKFRLLLLQMW